MVDVKTLMSQLLQQLSILHGMSFKNARTRQDLQKAIYNLGQLVAHYSREFASASAAAPVVTESASVSDLTKFADYLDANGFYALADRVDSIIELLPYKKASMDVTQEVSSKVMLKIADSLDKRGLSDLADIVDESALIIHRASDYGFFPKHKKQQVVDAEEAPVQMPCEGSLSTRYCPDHNGAQAIRIGEHIYQCPIDGKKYNYETGYVNYEGQIVPGGSVAAQTPTTSDYGGIPMRIYDSRSDVLNRLN